MPPPPRRRRRRGKGRSDRRSFEQEKGRNERNTERERRTEGGRGCTLGGWGQKISFGWNTGSSFNITLGGKPSLLMYVCRSKEQYSMEFDLYQSAHAMKPSTGLNFPLGKNGARRRWRPKLCLLRGTLPLIVPGDREMAHSLPPSLPRPFVRRHRLRYCVDWPPSLPRSLLPVSSCPSLGTITRPSAVTK